MGTEGDKIRLRWYHVRRVKCTGEYLGGGIGGFGSDSRNRNCLRPGAVHFRE